MIQVTPCTGDKVHDTGDRVHCTGSNLKVRLCKVGYHSVRGHDTIVSRKYSDVHFIPVI